MLPSTSRSQMLPAAVACSVPDMVWSDSSQLVAEPMAAPAVRSITLPASFGASLFSPSRIEPVVVRWMPAFCDCTPAIFRSPLLEM